MTDPVLFAHRAPGSVRLFEFSGLRTTSIRDQMVRAGLLVERLMQAQHDHAALISKDHPLVVVGAGAGGVTAAMHAAAAGIPVVVLEKNRHPFRAQADSLRPVDPTEYDWPAEHHEDGAYPAHSHHLFHTTPPTLPWKRSLSKLLAGAWERRLRNFVQTNPLLEIRYGTNAERAEFVERSDHVEYSSSGLGSLERFGAAVSFAGFRSERCDVPAKGGRKYVGYGFWEPDPVTKLATVLRKDATVVVSGGGDGGLQDFIRVLTKGNSAGYALRAFASYRPNLVRLMQAEDQAQRACLWSRVDQCSVLSAWHAAFVKEAHRIVSLIDGPSLGALASQLEIQATLNVKLIHGCTHFDYCYALNRFVALLLAGVYAKLTHKNLDQVLVGGCRIESVTPSNQHNCGVPGKCLGEPHSIARNGARCDGSLPALPDLSADAVFIRHGVTRQPFFEDPPLARQLVPYHLF